LLTALITLLGFIVDYDLGYLEKDT
jgi:hypothetical protein